MAVTDPIADMLTIIRNATRAKKPVAEVRASRLTEEILKIFKKETFISNYKMIKDSRQGLIRIYFKYLADGTPSIMGLKRISKPGLRIYKKRDELPRVYSGLGKAIVSTSKGLMTNDEARANKLGGEIICYVW